MTFNAYGKDRDGRTLAYVYAGNVDMDREAAGGGLRADMAPQHGRQGEAAGGVVSVTSVVTAGGPPCCPHSTPSLERALTVLAAGAGVGMHDLPDGAPLGVADQSGEPPLALDQRQVAQIVAAVMLGGKIRVILCGRPIGLRHCPLGEQYFSGVEKFTTVVHGFAVFQIYDSFVRVAFYE